MRGHDCPTDEMCSNRDCMLCEYARAEMERRKAARLARPAHDPINHPKHYTSHKSGVEAITVCEHMGFNLGNAMKYLWRADEKGAPIEDLEKARWYIDREIQRRKKQCA